VRTMICVQICRGYVGALVLMCGAPISIDVCVRTQKRVWICRGSFADV